MTTEKRLRSGIPKLDEIIEGGFVPGAAVLVAGEPGTGKTIFSTQFLYEGAKNGEPGLYITLEQSPEEIIKDMSRFDWDLSDLPVDIEWLNPTQSGTIEEKIKDRVNELGAKRIVIDSLSSIGLFLPDEQSVRTKFYSIKETLKNWDVTTLLVSEVGKDSSEFGRFGVEEFIADGIIKLNVGVDVIGGSPRTLMVRKMRRTNHSLDVHPIKITKNGMEIINS